ncbi:hypothetical protein EMIT0196P_70193 [Pseudomonas chlororaphis]
MSSSVATKSVIVAVRHTGCQLLMRLLRGCGKCSGYDKKTRFLTGNVVPNWDSVTEGYRQRWVAEQNEAFLKPAYLLGWSGACFFRMGFCYVLRDRRALLRRGLGCIM